MHTANSMAVQERQKTTVSWYRDLSNISVLHNSLTHMDDRASLNGHIVDHAMTISCERGRDKAHFWHK